MQQVDEQPMETIHLYVVREEEPHPSLVPLVCSVLFLLCVIAAGIVVPYKPAYEQKTLTLPAYFFTRTFTASTAIIPTGIKTYPATNARGELTIYNGSILQQDIPAGMIFTTASGIEVVTDTSAIVPAGNPPSYGTAIVQAHTVLPGAQGNIPSYAINQVYGASLYIRNIQAFHGGENAYSIKVVTTQDKQTAIDTARSFLASQEAHRQAILAKPCYESSHIKNLILRLSWTCQYFTFPVPSNMRVTHVQLFGNKVFVDVVFVARPERIETK